MKIKVKENGRPALVIPFPLFFITNRLSRKLMKNFLPSSVPISSEDINRFFVCLRQCKKQFGRLVLVQVESADGDKVKIQL